MMMTNAILANATPLPIVLLLKPAAEPAVPEIISDLAAWSAAVGRTSADVAAILFRMPLVEDLRAAFEDSIRQEIAGRIEALIALLDRMDGDPDAEPAGDDEPSLGWTLTMAHGNRDDLEEPETPARMAGDRE